MGVYCKGEGIEMSRIKEFLKGFASAFDITGSFFKFPDYSKGVARDREALSQDWSRIGGDFRRAMGIVCEQR